MRTWLGLAFTAAMAAAFVALAPQPPALAKDGKPEKEVAESPRWRRTYGEALREARLRNVPVLVSRHKDG
jgi:hypothetical protein